MAAVVPAQRRSRLHVADAINDAAKSHAGGAYRARSGSLRWYVNRLRCMSLLEIPHRVSRLARCYADAFWPHAIAAPATDAEPSPRGWVRVPPEIDPRPYVAAADRIVRGSVPVFGLRAASAGDAPDWNRDPRSGICGPLAPGRLLDYRNRHIVGDIRYVWELNRHLHLVTLAQAFALTRDARYVRTLEAHLSSWVARCPVGRGPNWCSALEASIRLINWSIAWQLLQGTEASLTAPTGGNKFAQMWMCSVYQHAAFIRHNLSRHSSANNHLIGEAAGLYIAGLTWPCWPALRRWRRTARAILDREATQQNAADGVNLEQSTGYQRFVLEFLLLALLAGRAHGLSPSSAYLGRLHEMFGFLASIMDVGGNVPMIGDADDGAVTRLAPQAKCGGFRSLLAAGALLFQSAEFKAKASDLDDATRWLFGPRARDAWGHIGSLEAAAPARREFGDGGYYVLGCDLETRSEIRLVVDAGALGYGRLAAHGHADALAFTLSVGGFEFLVDPGTYAYHGGGEWRDYFRGTSAHNTARVDGVDQSEPGGDFLWLHKARAGCVRFRSTPGEDVFEGWHDGYERLVDPVTHRRCIVLDKDRREITITDWFQMSGEHELELFFHCDERCDVRREDGCIVISRAPWRVVLTLPDNPAGTTTVHRAANNPLRGWISRHYDRKLPTHTISWRMRRAGDTKISTTLLCRSD
jgi:hypothetical protein